MRNDHETVMDLLEYDLTELEEARDRLIGRAHGETNPELRRRLQRHLACLATAIDRKITGEALARQVINEMVAERLCE